jgi:hypothetical protein
LAINSQTTAIIPLVLQNWHKLLMNYTLYIVLHKF